MCRFCKSFPLRNSTEKIRVAYRKPRRSSGFPRRRLQSGEIRQDVDVDEAASMFWQMFFGTSYELSFFQGLDTRKLSRSLHFLYSLLKA